MRSRSANTMRAEIVAYMIYLEGPEYSEYVMHIFYLKYFLGPKYGNMLGNSLPIGPAQLTTETYLKLFGLSTIKEYVTHIFLHKAFPGILQVIISNGMVMLPPPQEEKWQTFSHPITFLVFKKRFNDLRFFEPFFMQQDEPFRP